MRRILLTTDGSYHSLNGARYVSELYKGVSDLEVTILTVSAAVPPLFREETRTPSIRGQFEAWKKRREEEGKTNIEAAESVFLEGGMEKSRIKTRYEMQVVGVARDIVREMGSGHYDASVVGKKGMGWFHNVFLGSITSKLLEISKNHPLWLMEGKTEKPGKVIIAMDETEYAVTLARYAGLMLKGLKGVEILFYHYCSPFTEDLPPDERERLIETEQLIVEREKERMSHFFEEAQSILENLGFEKTAILHEFHYDQRSVHPGKVTGAILDKLKETGSGTLIIGRKGSTQAREFSLGSVTGRIATEAKDCCLWIV